MNDIGVGESGKMRVSYQLDAHQRRPTPMTRFCRIFSQLLQLFPRTEFQHAVAQTKAERHARGFTCWGQFVAMMFYQLAGADSLRRSSTGCAVAAFWRLAETAILGVITLNSIVVLLLLSGADYLQAFRTDQLQALAWLSIRAHAAGSSIGVIFFSLGSTVFSYLLFKSNYIPRTLAAWGIFSSLLLLTCVCAIIIFPNSAKIVTPGCYAPIIVFEVTTGLWLLVKGVRASGVAEPDKASG